MLIESQDRNILKHGTWALSNLIQGTPLPNLEQVVPAIPAVSKVIKTQLSGDIMSDASRSLTYLTRSIDACQMAIETGIIPTIVSNLK